MAKVSVMVSGVTKGEQRGAVAPGRNKRGGAKQPQRKYFTINDHKREYIINFVERPKSSQSQQTC